jgi:hypothetical protein
VEYAAVPLHVRVVHRLVFGVVERGVRKLDDLHDVAEHEEAGDLRHVVVFVQVEFGGEPASMGRVHVGGHGHADHRGELPLAEARLDEGEQVVGRFLLGHRVGVAGNAELLAVVDLHPGEEEVEVLPHHTLQGNERVSILQPDEPGDPGADGHLHPGERRRCLAGIPQAHQQIEGQVRDERERVGGVDGLGRHQREDVLGVVIPEILLLRLAQVLVGGDHDAVLGQLVQHCEERPVLALLEHAHQEAARVQLFFGRAAVEGAGLNPGPELLLETADPFHEELVDVRADDGDELGPLEQGHALVFRLGENAEVEVQPGELPVEVVLGVAEVVPAVGVGLRHRAGIGWRGPVSARSPERAPRRRAPSAETNPAARAWPRPRWAGF